MLLSGGLSPDSRCPLAWIELGWARLTVVQIFLRIQLNTIRAILLRMVIMPLFGSD